MIDWNQLWLEARRQKTWQGKTRADWNQRAAGFAKRHKNSAYAREFIDCLYLTPQMTVLDMGAGPGSLAIPMAGLVKMVTAVDFSPEMLAILRQNATDKGLNNIKIINGSWEDDWQALGIVPHDLVVASRSLAVDDLRGALQKLNHFARQRVVIGDRVGNGPFDPALFAALGRQFTAGPDYIYTLNVLYQMGIHAKVAFIEPGQGRTYESRQAAIDSCSWMLGEMTPTEHEKLQIHLDSRLQRDSAGQWRLTDEARPKWAVIQWSK